MSQARSSSEQLVLPSELDELECVDKETLRRAREVGFDEDKQAMVAIAVIEAVTNAIVHGNACADGKSVTVRYDCRPGVIKVIVHDEGEGFDLSRVGDPTQPGRRMECSGRGIFIMRQIMDSVEFDMSGGTTVTMMKAT